MKTDVRRLKKIFLTLSLDEHVKTEFIKITQNNPTVESLIFEANSVNEAWQKLDNARPDMFLGKVDAENVQPLAQFLTEVLSDKLEVKTGFLLFCEEKDKELSLALPTHEKLSILPGQPNEFQILDKMNKLMSQNVFFSDEYNYEMVRLKPGEILFKEAADADAAYLLKAGQLHVIRNYDKPEKRQLGIVKPGEFVGELALIVPAKRSATVISTAQSELIKIPKDSLDALIYNNPLWSRALIQTLCKRIRSMMD